jgi:hypothetical protein
MNRIFTLVLIIAALASCYHGAKDANFEMSLVLPEDSMVTLLTDLHLAEGAVTALKSKQHPAGHLSSDYFETILIKHSINKEVFEESMRYYAFHSEKLDKIYEQVIIDLSMQESLSIPKNDTVQKPAE